MDLSSKEAVLARLQEAGIWSKKKLGQHFLIDKKVLETIVEAADIQKADTIVEIGPGMGVLSQELLKKAGKVIAFEYDEDMVAFLKKNLPDLNVVAGDVLQTAHLTVPQLKEYKVVANIPYQITSPLLKLFLEGTLKPSATSLTFLMQKEVGYRLAASPRHPGRSYFSILAQYYAEVIYVATVPPEAFWPAPKVDSAVVHLKCKEVLPFDLETTAAYLKFVKTFFKQPRKQLKNVIAGIKGVPTPDIEKELVGLGYKSSVRAQELTNEDWEKLFKHFS